MTVAQLAELSRRHLGMDLSLYHAHVLPDLDGATPSMHAPMADLASRILPRVLRQAAGAKSDQGVLLLQFSTRDVFPDEDDDVLSIDATHLFGTLSESYANSWNQLAIALFTVKQQVSQHLGRPRLRVHGSKHLTATTMLGHVFRAASGFQIEIRQRETFWATDCQPADTLPFHVVEEPGSYHTSSLFVEVNATDKTVRDAVRRYIQQNDNYPALSLRFTRASASAGYEPIDNARCCAMALQIRHSISTVVSQNEIADIHLFGAMPQALALMIGYHLNALRPVQLYEYIQGMYQPSYRLLMDGI